MKKIHNILAAIVFMSVCSTAYAQEGIFKIVEKIQKSPTVIERVQSEQRNPDTKLILQSNTTIKFTDWDLVLKFMKEIEKERANSILYTFNESGWRRIYEIGFIYKKQEYKYTVFKLAQKDRNGKSIWVLRSEISGIGEAPAKYMKSKPRRVRRADINTGTYEYEYYHDDGTDVLAEIAKAQSEAKRAVRQARAAQRRLKRGSCSYSGTKYRLGNSIIIVESDGTTVQL